MTRALLAAFFCLALATPALAGSGGKGRAASTPAAADTAIRWMTLDEVQAAMKKEPRKVVVDVYTHWCGWCKVMDKKTFAHPEVIRYVNKNFYAVKLNAEQKEPIRFAGSMYNFENGANQFAVGLLRGQMSYPTTVVMEENFQNPQPIPGYLNVQTFEMILKYLGEGAYKTQKFEEWQAVFKPTWTEAAQ